MSDHTDTTLTDTERRYAYEHFGDDDEHFGRCYLEADVESIVAARVAAARAEAWDEGNEACCYPAYTHLNPYRALIEGADQ